MPEELTVSNRRQGVYWILTIPEGEWTPWIKPPASIAYIRGQLEMGAQGTEGDGYRHWQVMVCFSKKQSLHGVKSIFGSERLHAELSRSDACRAYVWKDETSLGQRFEHGQYPTRRNNATDWDFVFASAAEGNVSPYQAMLMLQTALL